MSTKPASTPARYLFRADRGIARDAGKKAVRASPGRPSNPRSCRGGGTNRLLGAKIQLQAWRDDAQLAEGARLELADALAGDAERRADFLERLRGVAVEAESPW